MHMRVHLLVAALLLTPSFTTEIDAQQSITLTKIELLDRVDAIASVASQVSKVLTLDPNRRIVVSGAMEVSTPVIGAREIIFKPDSRIVLQTGPNSEPPIFYVVVDRIVNEDPNKPGKITWNAAPADEQKDRGKAQSGSPASAPGANGGPGTAGTTGLSGNTGRTAPAVVMFARDIGAGLIIDLTGGEGGRGGKGQEGGDGRAGAQGGPARQDYKEVMGAKVWLPNCASGPGRGGNGGAGGKGGTGGTGGAGGSGGSFTIVSLPEKSATISQSFNITTSGGPPGRSGDPGDGGKGGDEGPEGQLANFCNSAGRHGDPGPNGARGDNGQPGTSGKAGAAYYSTLTNEQFKNLFNF